MPGNERQVLPALQYRWIAVRLALGAAPLILLITTLYAEYSANVVAVDFRNAFYPAARDILHGATPYTLAEHADRGAAYVYTPVAAGLMIPFALLPLEVAQALISALLIACFVLTPYVLGIRDWRVFGAMLLWPTFVSGLQTANLTLLLGLLVAVAWRTRERRYTPGVLLGLTIAMKSFLWPLMIWELATRRYRAFAVSLVIVSAALLTVLPFMSLTHFATLVSNHSGLFDDRSYTVYGLLVDAGFPDIAARSIWLAVGLGVLILGRKNFSLCLVAALLLSPIVWLHYFALLAVPLAIARAPIWLWLAPLALWLVPGWENGDPWQSALVLTVAIGVVLAAEARRHPRPLRQLAGSRVAAALRSTPTQGAREST